MINLLARLLGGGPLIHVITAGQSGGSVGWDNSGTTFGTITNGAPAIGTTGEVINGIYTVFGGSRDLTVITDTEGLLQDDFTAIHLQDNLGVWRTYLTADADTFGNSGVTLWAWGDGTDDVWDDGDTGIVSAVYLT
jgi:hypothetical protein